MPLEKGSAARVERLDASGLGTEAVVVEAAKPLRVGASLTQIDARNLKQGQAIKIKGECNGIYRDSSFGSDVVYLAHAVVPK